MNPQGSSGSSSSEMRAMPLQAVAVMQQGAVVDLDARLALLAARISLERKLPMADSVILATARAYGATVWTQDADFKDLPGVQFRKHTP